jgi:hypothetical protein
MKLKQVDGKVSFIMRAGKDFVKDEMPVDEAKKLVKNGETTESDKFDGYTLCVNDTYFFATATPKKKTDSKE